MVTKIKLNEKETKNLTTIKKNDIVKIIQDIKYICDQVKFDTKICFPGKLDLSMSNPIEDINNLQDTIDFILDEYDSYNWEDDTEKAEGYNTHTKESAGLREMLMSMRSALHNSKMYALTASRHKELYMRQEKAYYENKKKNIFVEAERKVKDKELKDAGWCPEYDDIHQRVNYKYYYTYRDGYKYSLDNIERYDKKPILSFDMIKKKASGRQ